jgi:hypothetical protein
MDKSTQELDKARSNVKYLVEQKQMHKKKKWQKLFFRTLKQSYFFLRTSVYIISSFSNYEKC